MFEGRACVCGGRGERLFLVLAAPACFGRPHAGALRQPCSPPSRPFHALITLAGEYNGPGLPVEGSGGAVRAACRP